MQLDYGSNALSQHIVTRLLSSDDYDDHIQQLRNQLSKRAAYTEQLLKTYLSNDAQWKSPKGGFYIWVTFKEPIVTKSLFLRLLKRNVLINPGYVYSPRDTIVYEFHSLTVPTINYDQGFKYFRRKSQGTVPHCVKVPGDCPLLELLLLTLP